MSGRAGGIARGFGGCGAVARSEWPGWGRRGIGRPWLQAGWAEGVGFEPTEALASHAFQACPFGRSGNPPEGPHSGHRMARVSSDRIVPLRGVAVGSCATSACEPSQGRKAAALSRIARVPQIAWPSHPGAGTSGSGCGEWPESRVCRLGGESFSHTRERARPAGSRPSPASGASSHPGAGSHWPQQCGRIERRFVTHGSGMHARCSTGWAGWRDLGSARPRCVGVPGAVRRRPRGRHLYRP